MRTFAATTHYKSSGHIWQGRFKLFPIQQDEHLLTVLRYVERNPVRAELVERAEQWIWSSAHHWAGSSDRPAFLIPGPVRRPKKWLDRANQATSPPELSALRRSAIRGTPYGEATWNVSTANLPGLESTLRPRGRPRKVAETKQATESVCLFAFFPTARASYWPVRLRSCLWRW